MLTPVFLDNLPDAAAVTGARTDRHRHQRNRALAELLLDEDVAWQDRVCPGCGAPQETARHFTRGPLPFLRCTGCNTIYAARVPGQRVLDGLRGGEAEALMQRDGAAAPQLRDLEFVSILNWIRLSAPRYGRRVERALDYRFASHASDWPASARRLGEGMGWTHLPLSVTAEAEPPFADFAQALAEEQPDAVLLQSEIDRAAQPAGLLATLRAGLAPGAMVFASTSCAEGLEYEILGADSPSFVPLDRLTMFSVGGFRRMAEREGFRCLEMSTPGRLDAVILHHHFTAPGAPELPFWSGFFRDATRDRLQDLQMLLQRSLRSGVMRFVLTPR